MYQKLRIVWRLKPTSGKIIIACMHAEVSFILEQLFHRGSYPFAFRLLILFFVFSLVCFGFSFGSEGSNLFLSFPRRPRSGWNTKLTEHDKPTDEQLRMFLILRKRSLRKLLLVLPESPSINFREQEPMSN